MIRILVVTHASLGDALIASAKMLGAALESVDAISFDEDMGIEQLTEEVRGYLSTSQEDTLIFTDIMGGSPFNVVSMETYERSNIKVFYGVNLPLFVEAIAQRVTLELTALAQHLEEQKHLSLGLSTLTL